MSKMRAKDFEAVACCEMGSKRKDSGMNWGKKKKQKKP